MPKRINSLRFQCGSEYNSLIFVLISELFLTQSLKIPTPNLSSEESHPLNDFGSPSTPLVLDLETKFLT